MISRFYRCITDLEGRKIECTGISIGKILITTHVPIVNGLDIFRSDRDYTLIEVKFSVDKFLPRSQVIHKIWREDIFKWESKIKNIITYYKYTIRDGATVKTIYSIIRK